MTTATQAADNRGRVMVVDDDQDMLNLLRKWLEGAGFEVSVAASGNEALSMLATSRPDIVITDLFMEGMDGLTLVTNIHAGNPLMPVIMLSELSGEQDIVRALNAGALDYVVKPFTPDLLSQRIDETMSKVAA